MKINKISITVCVAIGVIILIGILSIRWLKSEIHRTEFTESTALENVVIGDDALKIPQNYFRFKIQRDSAVLKQADLAMLWSDGSGYQETQKDKFQDSQNLIFITIKKRELKLDMDGRYMPIYQQLLDGTSTQGPSGMILHNFKNNVGYDGEQLAVWRNDTSFWVARCYAGKDSVQSTCLHDMNMGNDLVVIYRFNANHLSEWREIHGLVTQKLNEYIAQ